MQKILHGFVSHVQTGLFFNPEDPTTTLVPEDIICVFSPGKVMLREEYRKKCSEQSFTRGYGITITDNLVMDCSEQTDCVARKANSPSGTEKTVNAMLMSEIFAGKWYAWLEAVDIIRSEDEILYEYGYDPLQAEDSSDTEDSGSGNKRKKKKRKKVLPKADVKSVLAADPDVIASNAFFRASLAASSAAVVGIAIPDERSTASLELLSSDVMMADSKAEPFEEDTNITTSSMSAIAVDPHIAASSASATVAIPDERSTAPDDTGVGSALAVDSIPVAEAMSAIVVDSDSNALVRTIPGATGVASPPELSSDVMMADITTNNAIIERLLMSPRRVAPDKEITSSTSTRGTRVLKAAQAVSKTAVGPTTVQLKENLEERIKSARGNMYCYEGNDIIVETFNRCILPNVSFVLLYINVLLYAQ